MPTYQYACTACGHQLEAVQSFTDEPLSQCPACEGRLRKLFGSVGVVFKGSGFYRTDSRAAANGKTGKSDEGKPGDTKSGEGKTGKSDDGKAGANGKKGGESASPASSGSTSAGGSKAAATTGS